MVAGGHQLVTSEDELVEWAGRQLMSVSWLLLLEDSVSEGTEFILDTYENFNLMK
jgi:hypothetical protein